MTLFKSFSTSRSSDSPGVTGGKNRRRSILSILKPALGLSCLLLLGGLKTADVAHAQFGYMDPNSGYSNGNYNGSNSVQFSNSFRGAPGGWEMVSVPYEVDSSYSFQNLRLPAYILDPPSNTYLQADSFHLGRAYWVYQTNDWSLQATGQQATYSQPFGIQLQQGWNMVGDPFTQSIPLSNISVLHSDGTNVRLLDDNTTSYLYVYNGAIGQYSPPNGLQSPNQTLDPYQGAWLYSMTNSTLYFYPSNVGSNGNNFPSNGFPR